MTTKVECFKAYIEATRAVKAHYKSSGLEAFELKVRQLTEDDDGNYLFGPYHIWLGDGPEPDPKELEYPKELEPAWLERRELLRAARSAKIAYLEAGGSESFPDELIMMKTGLVKGLDYV